MQILFMREGTSAGKYDLHFWIRGWRNTKIYRGALLLSVISSMGRQGRMMTMDMGHILREYCAVMEAGAGGVGLEWLRGQNLSC